MTLHFFSSQSSLFPPLSSSITLPTRPVTFKCSIISHVTPKTSISFHYPLKLSSVFTILFYFYAPLTLMLVVQISFALLNSQTLHTSFLSFSSLQPSSSHLSDHHSTT